MDGTDLRLHYLLIKRFTRMIRFWLRRISPLPPEVKVGRLRAMVFILGRSQCIRVGAVMLDATPLHIWILIMGQSVLWDAYGAISSLACGQKCALVTWVSQEPQTIDPIDALRLRPCVP